MKLVKRLSLDIVIDLLAFGLVAAAAETGIAEEVEASEYTLNSPSNPIVYELNPPDNEIQVSQATQATAPTLAPAYNHIDNSSPVTDVTPFNLVNLAQKGYFKAEGIPGYDSLSMAYKEGKITAKDIVAAAVNSHKLSQIYLTDQSYISAVEVQLRTDTTFY